MKRRSLRVCALVIMFMLILQCVPVFAQTNLVLGIKVNQAKNAKDWGASLIVGLQPTAKYASDGVGRISGTVLLPEDLLASKNEIDVDLQSELHDPSIHEGDDRIGNVPSLYNLKIKVNSKGTPKLSAFIPSQDNKEVKVGSLASIKKSGRLYVLKLNNIPLEKIYFPADAEWNPENAKQIDTTKKYYYGININIYAGKKISKKVNSYVYIDKMSLKVSKTIKLSVENMNFRWFDGWMGKGENWKSTPRRIANISY